MELSCETSSSNLPKADSHNILCPLTQRPLPAHTTSPGPCELPNTNLEIAPACSQMRISHKPASLKIPNFTGMQVCPSLVAARVPIPGAWWVQLPVPCSSPGRAGARGAEHPLPGGRAHPPLFQTFFHLPSTLTSAAPEGLFLSVTLKPKSSHQGTAVKEQNDSNSAKPEVFSETRKFTRS